MLLKLIATKNYKGTTSQQPTKKTEESKAAKINKQAKAITSKLKFKYHIESFPTQKAFITLEDHKPNFVNNPKCHLIKPIKIVIKEQKMFRKNK